MKQVNLDCEGPITRNDNALEISQHFLPRGEKFFSLLSSYDDFLAEIVRKKGYKAGTTLIFILPFLKAYGVANKKIKEYSRNHLDFIAGAKRTLSYLKKKFPTFIISTSYEPYIEALCDSVNFPRENTYSTALDLDRYQMTEKEAKQLKGFLEEIVSLPSLDLSGIKKREDLSPEMQKTVERLDEIFDKEISSMECGRILKEVTPLGGEEKVKAVLDSIQKTGVKLRDVIYVGDSVTDVEALKLVKEEGLAISFNGNAYALRAAEIACLSPHTFPLEILAEVFHKEDKKGVLTLAEKWPNSLASKTKEKILTLGLFPEIEIITENNLQELIKKSEGMRKELRGEIVGGLG